MKQFKKILVGVDLSQGDWQVSDSISPATQSLVKQAAAVAKQAGALLHVRAVLELDEKTIWMLEHYGAGPTTVVEKAQMAIDQMVEELRDQNVNARGDVALGKAWVELTRYAADAKFDVVMVGSKQRGRIAGWIVGSTGRHLLRSCGTPVWIHKDTDHAPLQEIMVATDFSDIAGECLELGIAVASAVQETLHVLHVAELPSEKLLRWGNMSDEKITTAREHIVSDARAKLDELAKSIDETQFAKPVNVHLLSGNAANVILDQAKQYQVDLLIMGTQTHHREMWHMMGSTAERLLSSLDSSLLAVKPNDFKSPVH